jgi:hypothetical protein
MISLVAEQEVLGRAYCTNVSSNISIYKARLAGTTTTVQAYGLNNG